MELAEKLNRRLLPLDFGPKLDRSSPWQKEGATAEFLLVLLWFNGGTGDHDGKYL